MLKLKMREHHMRMVLKDEVVNQGKLTTWKSGL